MPPLPANQTPPSETQPNLALNTEKLSFELEKLKREIAKFEAETVKANLEAAELRKGWYKKPAMLQPIAAIVLTLGTAVLGYFNGWFDVKLTALRNEEKQASDELKELNSTRSDLRAQIANLTAERDHLNQKLSETLHQAGKLEAKYALAAVKAAQGERYRHDAEEARKQIQETIAEATAARAAAEAAVWHPGDVIEITAKDATTAKPIPRFLVMSPLKSWTYGKIDLGLGNGGYFKPRVGTSAGVTSDVYFGDFALEQNPLFAVAGSDGKYRYRVSKADISMGQVQLTLGAPGYQNTSVLIPSGVKAFTILVNAERSKLADQNK